MYAKDCYLNYNDITILNIHCFLDYHQIKQIMQEKSLYDYCHEKKVMQIGKFIVDSGLMSANYLNR